MGNLPVSVLGQSQSVVEDSSLEQVEGGDYCSGLTGRSGGRLGERCAKAQAGAAWAAPGLPGRVVSTSQSESGDN